MNDVIKKIRKKIDTLDKEILQRLNTRGLLAKDIAKAKSVSNDKNIFRPEREAQILRKIISENKGPLNDGHLYSIYKEIISSCLSLETEVQVSYLGPEGSFSSSALKKFFGSSVTTSFKSSILEIFNDVESKRVDYGIVPIENSNQGSINQTLDYLISKDIVICGEVNYAIKHCLLSKNKNLKGIKKIYSHEQSFMQCSDWILKNLPNCEKYFMSSNSAAAKKVSKLSNAAAIASNDCSFNYKLNIIEKNIHDKANNTTRFIIIGKNHIAPSGSDKTSIIISLKNKSGALNSILEPLSKNKISMTKIESIPTKINNWEYMFLMDIDGHIAMPNINKTLSTIKSKSLFYKHLGSYPKSI